MIINNFINRLAVRLFCKKVGQDEFGNSYYISKSGNKYVVYNGVIEASKIPPNWHMWIHNISDQIIPNSQYAWQKIHTPNLTGTKYHHQVPEIKTKYQSWSPNSDEK